MATRKPPRVSIKKPSIKVPTPKVAAFPKPKKAPRTYTKQAANQDPSQYADFGFGDTGLSGES